MSVAYSSLRSALSIAAAIGIAGCASTRPAPVSERTPPPRTVASAPATKPAPSVSLPRAGAPKGDTYTVKPGDTLYSIALEHGLDYRELAIWNGIENPSALRAGQQLQVRAPADAVVTAPLKGATGTVQAQPLGGPLSAPPAASAVPPTASAKVVTEPRGVRVPYSEQALAQVAKPEASGAPTVAEAPRPEVKPETPRGTADLDWAWPVRGQLIGTFNDASSKGIAIAGKLGQPVLASAPGRVIFSGTGIRGFGKLIVIKHNNTYLSVYAHNSALSVKEGQNVTKGQKIAEMGSTDADRVKLHFEIRRFGKPVDPLKLLPSAA